MRGEWIKNRTARAATTVRYGFGGDCVSSGGLDTRPSGVFGDFPPPDNNHLTGSVLYCGKRSAGRYSRLAVSQCANHRRRLTCLPLSDFNFQTIFTHKRDARAQHHERDFTLTSRPVRKSDRSQSKDNVLSITIITCRYIFFTIIVNNVNVTSVFRTYLRLNYYYYYYSPQGSPRYRTLAWTSAPGFAEMSVWPFGINYSSPWRNHWKTFQIIYTFSIIIIITFHLDKPVKTTIQVNFSTLLVD